MLELSDPDFIKQDKERKSLLKLKLRKYWQEKLARDSYMDEIIFGYQEIFYTDTTTMTQAEIEHNRDILEAAGVKLNNPIKGQGA